MTDEQSMSSFTVKLPPNFEPQRKPPRLTLSDDKLADLEAATYTASEVKVLTETAGEAGRRIGRAEAADKLAATFGRRAQMAERVPEGERSGVREGMVVTWIAAQRLAEDMASLPFTAASDATSGVPGHQEVSEAVRSPQEPCGHPTCPCTSQEAR